MMDMHIHIRDIINKTNSIDEFILEEKKYDVRELCFLEHGNRISKKHQGFLVDNSSFEQLNLIVQRARKLYPDLNIFNGIEIDYSKDSEFRSDTLNYLAEENFDIVIGSIHSYKFENGLDYFNAIIDMINNYPINIVGHIKLRDNWDEYKKNLEDIIVLCAKKNIKIEINTSDRSIWNEEQFVYMLSKMKENRVEFTIGSDAHHLDEIGKNYVLVNKRLKGGF